VFVGVVHQHKYKKIEIDKFWIDDIQLGSLWSPGLEIILEDVLWRLNIRALKKTLILKRGSFLSC